MPEFICIQKLLRIKKKIWNSTKKFWGNANTGTRGGEPPRCYWIRRWLTSGSSDEGESVECRSRNGGKGWWDHEKNWKEKIQIKSELTQRAVDQDNHSCKNLEQIIHTFLKEESIYRWGRNATVFFNHQVDDDGKRCGSGSANQPCLRDSRSR